MENFLHYNPEVFEIIYIIIAGLVLIYISGFVAYYIFIYSIKYLYKLFFYTSGKYYKTQIAQDNLKKIDMCISEAGMSTDNGSLKKHDPLKLVSFYREMSPSFYGALLSWFGIIITVHPLVEEIMNPQDRRPDDYKNEIIIRILGSNRNIEKESVRQIIDHLNKIFDILKI